MVQVKVSLGEGLLARLDERAAVESRSRSQTAALLIERGLSAPVGFVFPGPVSSGAVLAGAEVAEAGSPVAAGSPEPSRPARVFYEARPGTLVCRRCGRPRVAHVGGRCPSG